MAEQLQPDFLRVHNWEKFQHYKDRRPPWIKLHVELTDDYSFAALSDIQKYHLIGIWLLAARTDNKIPNDPDWVAARIEARSAVDLYALIEAGFLAPWRRAAGAKAKWGSRYISKDLRAEILERDNHKCCECSSTKNLEIDHRVPVSKGGESKSENLQVLCRSCNRAKRARVSAEQPATQKPKRRGASVLLETEEETEAKREPEQETDKAQGFSLIRNTIDESLREAS